MSDWLIACRRSERVSSLHYSDEFLWHVSFLAGSLPPPPPPPLAGGEGLWLAASQLIECSWHCCSRGQIGTFASQAEKSGFGEIAPPCPSATKAPLKMQIFIFLYFYETTLLSCLAISNLPFRGKGKRRRKKKVGRKKCMACDSVEIGFFILTTKEANEGISLVFILGQCDFLLFANTK